MRNPDEQAEYKDKLAAMTGQQLFEEAKSKIWLSNDNSRSRFHWQADYTYNEAQRRGAPKIYSDAYRVTYMSCGYPDPHPDQGEICEVWPWPVEAA